MPTIPAMVCNSKPALLRASSFLRFLRYQEIATRTAEISRTEPRTMAEMLDLVRPWGEETAVDSDAMMEAVGVCVIIE